MATDYISRAAAIRSVCEDCEYYDANDCEECRFDRLLNIPAADVRPIVRGFWTRIDYKPCGHDYQCSVCGFKNDDATKFCPDCGAMMEHKYIWKGETT